MLINEKKLRELVRTALIKETTQPRYQGRIESIDQATKNCPYYTEIPAKFAKLFSSTTAQEFTNLLTKMSPRLANDFDTLGIGRKSGKSGIVSRMDPSDIGSVTESDNAIQIIAGYFNSYLYVSGFGCLQYYYLGKILGLLGTILGDQDASDAAKVSEENKGSLSGNFKDGIYDVSVSLSKRYDVDKFRSLYSFYCFPTLCGIGPEAEDLDALTSDLEDLQEKIYEINQIREKYGSETFKAIGRILDIKSTKFYEENLNMFVDTDDQNNLELSQKLKSYAVADLLMAVEEGRKSFEHGENTIPEFKEKLRNFFGRNTK